MFMVATLRTMKNAISPIVLFVDPEGWTSLCLQFPSQTSLIYFMQKVYPVN